MTSSDNARDTLTRQVRNAYFTETPSAADMAALARIRQRLQTELARTQATDIALQPTSRKDRVPIGRIRSRRRVATIVLATIVVITVAAVAAAQSDSIRDFFTADTPSTHRMQAFRVTPSPSAFDRSSTTPIPARMHALLEQLYREDPDAVIQRFGALKPRDTTRQLLDGRWNDRTIAIYARPTSRDNVCYAVSLGDGNPTTANCFASYFDLDAPIKIGGTVDQDPASAIPAIRLFGLAADEVTGVTILLDDGTTSEALMGTNAFYWDNSGAASAPRSIDIHMVGARTVTHPVTRYISPMPTS